MGADHVLLPAPVIESSKYSSSVLRQDLELSLDPFRGMYDRWCFRACAGDDVNETPIKCQMSDIRY